MFGCKGGLGGQTEGLWALGTLWFVLSVPNEKSVLISMRAPERTTADAFPTYIGGQVVADSATLKWPGLFVRRYRFPRVVDGFLVPATAEPLIAGIIAGSAEFEEREVGGTWLPHRVRRGDLF